MKTYVLDAALEEALHEFARHSAFFRSIQSNYRKYGSVTTKQLQALVDEQNAALRIGGTLVVNRILRDGQLVCFYCSDVATHAVGRLGVCGTHARERNESPRGDDDAAGALLS